jgi:hypothetical protein
MARRHNFGEGEEPQRTLIALGRLEVYFGSLPEQPCVEREVWAWVLQLVRVAPTFGVCCEVFADSNGRKIRYTKTKCALIEIPRRGKTRRG